MRGSITRRGKSSWRIKFDLETNGNGERETRYVTVRGKRQDAERELAKLVGTMHSGTFVEASKTTVAEYLHAWLGGAHGLAGKTAERYRELAEQQIIPHLGSTPIQKLRPAQITEWHSKLLMEGGKNGAALSAATVGHAHRVLHRTLARAVKDELIARNVAAIIKPPKPAEREIETLAADQLAALLNSLDRHELEPIAVTALGSGARRGELLALTRGHIDLDKGTMRIERSLEQTRAGLKFKTPKTKNGRRTISLPPVAVEALRGHLLRQLEMRMALGQGKPDARTLMFSKLDGSPIPPNDLSRDWRRFIVARKLPAVSLHGLRHTHVSALISRGVDVLTISRRIGHANAAITLRVYGHLFEQNDGAAASAIEAALRGGKA